MSKVMPITCALAAAMLAAAPGALAQVTSSRDSATDSTSIRQALRGNFLEVALGRTAESRASDSTVKAFAQRMISEHNSMNQQWAALARKYDMRFDLSVDSAGRQSAERLEDLSGPAFDQAYMAEMLRHHEQDLAAYQRMGASAGDPEVRELANSGMPAIREHLALARQVGSRVGISTTAGRAPGGVTGPGPTPSNDARRRTDAERGNRDERDDRDGRNDRGALRAEDRAFVQNVLAGHLMHIRLAERAKRQARSDEIRRLADRMEEHYTEWQERWEDLAERYDVKAPSHLGPLHGQKVERLERASKRNFDRTYAAIVAENLESVVPYFQKEGQAVRPAAVRRLVDEELPVIRELLARARRLERQASARAEASERE